MKRGQFLFPIFLIALITFSHSTRCQQHAEWALNFDAENPNSYVDCGYDSVFYPANLTLEGWFYIEEWTSELNYILATESWTGEIGPHGYAVRVYKETGVEFVLGLGWQNTSQNYWGVISTGGETVDSLKWYHFAATYDGDKMKIYLNGQLITEQQFLRPMIPSNQNLIIGEGAEWKTRRLTGNLMDIRLWNVVRSKEEIENNKDRFLEGTETGLIANWKMNEGAGTTLTDACEKFPAEINSGVQWISMASLGIPEVTSKAILFYPNPAINEIFITGLTQPEDVKLYSIQGRLLKTVNQVETTFDISDLPAGIYILNLTSGDQVLQERIIKK